MFKVYAVSKRYNGEYNPGAVIPKSLLLFCKNENLSKAVVINKDVSMKITRDGIDFYFVPFIFSARILELL